MLATFSPYPYFIFEIKNWVIYLPYFSSPLQLYQQPTNSSNNSKDPKPNLNTKKPLPSFQAATTIHTTQYAQQTLKPNDPTLVHRVLILLHANTEIQRANCAANLEISLNYPAKPISLQPPTSNLHIPSSRNSAFSPSLPLLPRKGMDRFKFQTGFTLPICPFAPL
ncbi:hypothetical protein H5410_049031 [Solanum commersonii]|uniref:Uncharacterized protein n=1 Tax=Solanum commersonii TaxID=4109 RepID=A0A9J5XL86_SOLCO|nr:hypothetical protein H5410_049031 [Solanum commersonii]